ncbi:MAG: hypothetical protein IIA73_08595 [Proteobacteria bacterium]|nr:hypothetical protein [Pseudomonadota bacterium]
MLKWLDEQDPGHVAAGATAAVFALVFFLASVIGWFGVGLVGLAGLVLTHRIELSEGGVAGGFGATRDLYRKQLEEQAREAPRKRAADAGARQRMLSIMKTISLAVAALGFGGVMLQWS